MAIGPALAGLAAAHPQAEPLAATQAEPLAAEPAVLSASQVSVPAAPMGWASWNTYASQISYNAIKVQADALVSSGMAAAGYDYVNIDEGWWQGSRDSGGSITVSTTQWPGGMAAIASYIHSKGLN